MLYLSCTFLEAFGALILCDGDLYECPDQGQRQCGRCKSVNDPHITTFDGIFYDQHLIIVFNMLQSAHLVFVCSI